MRVKNKIKLGMPNLTYYGLDESWLFKFCGNIHWDLLHEIIDVWADGERFYASFFHMQLKFDNNQNSFKENDVIHFDSELFRYNDKIYRTVHKFDGGTLTMDTIFVKKQEQGSLVKYKPKEINDSTCKQIDNIGIVDHQIKKKQLLVNPLYDVGNLLSFPPSSLFNGVKILYCANYLFLVSLSEFVQFNKILGPIKEINISYYGNMSISDNLYGQSVLLEDEKSTETILSVNYRPIAYCEITR